MKIYFSVHRVKSACTDRQTEQPGESAYKWIWPVRQIYIHPDVYKRQGLLLFSEEGGAVISLPYTLMGIVVLAVAMVFSKIRLPEIVYEEEGAKEGKAKSLWSHKLFIFGIAALFCYEIAEISINSFFINYVVDDG